MGQDRTSGHKGGALLDVVCPLDELQDPGITALCFNPIWQYASNHRHPPHDTCQVDPLLGGTAAFDAMLRTRHDTGMRVVLERVFTHARRGCYPFNDVLENGEGSPRDIQHVTQDLVLGDLPSSETLVCDLVGAGTGLRHASRTFPPAPMAREPVSLECPAGMEMSVCGIQVLYTTDGSMLDASSESLQMMRHAVEWLDLDWSYGEGWRGTIPTQDEEVLVRYRIQSTTADGDVV